MLNDAHTHHLPIPPALQHICSLCYRRHRGDDDDCTVFVFSLSTPLQSMTMKTPAHTSQLLASQTDDSAAVMCLLVALLPVGTDS